jgi:MoaA/NifB/PqqE/SkfB family radical SAM enzyme
MLRVIAQSGGGIVVQYARRWTNSILKSGLDLLDSAPAAARQRAFNSIFNTLSLLDNTLLRDVPNEALVEAMRVVAEAVISTPYGEPLKYPTPLLITIGASLFCPHACTNCYSRSGAVGDRARDASGEIFERVAASRAPFVMISGGEPLSLPDINKRLKLLLDAGKFVYVATNSAITPITSEIADHPSRLFVFLSIWGTRDAHDKVRGKKSYERLERNLAQLNNLGSDGRLLLVLNDEDLAMFDGVEELVKRHRVRTIIVSRKFSVGRLDGASLKITPELTQRIEGRAAALSRYVKHVYLDIPELRVNQGLRSSHLRRLLGIPVSVECGAGNWMMHLDSEGMAFPCYTFEGRKDLGVDPNLQIAGQWALVRQVRARVPAAAATYACIGEAVDEG